MSKGFIIGYGDVIFGSILGTALAVYVTINGKNKAGENIKRLRWMKDHQYKIVKTEEEKKLIEESLVIQTKYMNKWFNIWVTPTVNWSDLPMDGDYAKKFC